MPEPSQKQSHMPFIFSRVVPAIALVIFLMIGYVIFTYEAPPVTKVKDRTTAQGIDAPMGIPLDEEMPEIFQTFDARFQFTSPWRAAVIPTSDYFSSPIGTETGTFAYNAQPFWEQNHTRGGGYHSGDDLNGIGGQNSDLGDPVFAAANGLVIYSGEPSAGWGKVIILAHRATDGNLYHSMYAHLHESHVFQEQLISRGEQIGTVGNAGGAYYAHLHFEMRLAEGITPFYNGYPLTYYDRIDPTGAILKNAAPSDKLLAPSIYKIALKNSISPDMPATNDAESTEAYRRWILRMIELEKQKSEQQNNGNSIDNNTE